MLIHLAADNLGGSTNINNLVHNNSRLQGKYKISIIAMHVGRANFATGKDELFFFVSDQLRPLGSGYRYLAMHEEPVADETSRKDYIKFSNDFEIVAQLNGTIRVVFGRAGVIGTGFQRALLVLDVEKIEENL